ncbi:hypothetical protein SKAU_G00427910 [Synaphobranchus kaupii]|uniref:E3 ubiquitin-protein ligase TRIM39-like n=1 Tax=Synaphobranchus kaupii TaxID=118154 RepID=A0A9Q1E4R5_SYNKA|nr:hypothetical protein SKAU_G00427910 [Synaphobranchus kaupii]
MASSAQDSEETPVLLRSHLKCSICLDLFNKPVTTQCGHSFCQRCLHHTLQFSEQVCPLCKTWLRQVDIKVNILLNGLVEDFHKAQERGTEEILDGGVACDMCIGRKLKAVKSCLVCLISYCQPHLERHLSARWLRGHKLVAPVSALEQRACAAHSRPLELYCRDTQRCVCALCVDDSRQVVPAEAEWDRKKDVIKNRMDEMKRRVEVWKRKVEDIRQEEELSTGHIERQQWEIEEVFVAVMARVQEAETQLLQPLMEKKREVQREMEQVTQEMEVEISDLQQRISDLDHAANHEDHILFLQRPPVPGPDARDWSCVSLDTELGLGSVREVLSAVIEQINKELEQLSSTDIERIQKFSVGVTFDPDTANPRLRLSDDRKEVWDTGVKQDVPELPERFDLFGSILGCPLLCSGRSYWEVQVGGKTGWDLGVAKESINRKGQVTMTPENGFWCLVLYNQDNYAAMTSPPLTLSLTSKPKAVGVYVDYEGGQVSFYNVEARTHIYSFTGYTFTEELYPYFSPHVCTNGKNSAPLIISPVIQT